MWGRERPGWLAVVVPRGPPGIEAEFMCADHDIWVRLGRPKIVAGAGVLVTGGHRSRNRVLWASEWASPCRRA